MTEPQPWQVWHTNFSPSVGREQDGRRPAIVVSTTVALNEPNDLVILVPCTTRDRGLPAHPRITSLSKPSVAMCDQVRSLSRQRLVQPLGVALTSEERDAVQFVLRQLIDVGA